MHIEELYITASAQKLLDDNFLAKTAFEEISNAINI